MRMDLQAFIARLQALPAAITEAETAALAEAGEIVKEKAKGYIGDYQEHWDPLAESTLKEKTALGYSPPDNPLLRTGEMRDSISFFVEDRMVSIGSPSKIALYQEVGTVRIPPRPFLGLALNQAAPEIVEMIGERVAKAVAGERE